MSSVPAKRQPIPFGQYLLLDRVNIGGMAEVWRAKTFGANGFERLVAIKRILPNIAEDEEFISMFIDEARITVQLNHANIAQIYELSHISNSYFIAMEYVSGRDLRALFERCRKRGEPAPIPLVCYVMSRCCEGFDYAHRRKDSSGRDMGIVHRDVSPQNALVSFDGEVKIIDFGIAKAAGKATKTQAGILKGKFGYMSPEQIRGLPLDRRSDVFAIGVCLYELLTGERLFVGDSDFSVLEKVRKVEVLPPSHFNRKITDALEKIVMKALAKDVEDRYQYASELGDDLQRFMVTSEAVFGRKDLANFMRATFAEELEKERTRLQEYAQVKAPEGMLLAAQAGYGAAAPAPVVAGPVPTALPTVAPSMPSATRPPVMAPPVAKPAPVVPKLTAAPVVVTVGKAEHDATQLNTDSEITNSGADEKPGPPVQGEVPTDPGLQALPVPVPPRGPPTPDSSLSDLLSPLPEMPELAAPPPGSTGKPLEDITEPPTLGGAKSPASAPAELDLTPPGSPAAVAPNFSQAPDPVTRPARSEPIKRAARSGSAVREVSQTKLIAAIAGGGLLAVLLIVVIISAFTGGKKQPQGLLYIDVPKDVASSARVNVNGSTLTDDDGKPVHDFPALKRVNAGKSTILITAPGYENLLETIVVAAGDEPTHLTKSLKKEAAEGTPP